MKKDLMYYVHKNRKDAWDKIAKISAKSGKSIVATVKECRVNSRMGINYSKGKEA